MTAKEFWHKRHDWQEEIKHPDAALSAIWEFAEAYHIAASQQERLVKRLEGRKPNIDPADIGSPHLIEE